jgi:uncharacterized protein RhaS with RHS repeats
MLPEIKLYHYKARVYDPATGRFLQTDPVGYQDDADLYAYVRDDPVDKADPTGQCAAAANMAVGTSLTCSSPGASITPRREVEFQAKGPAPLVAGAVAAAAVWNGAEKIGEQVSAAASALTAKKEPNYVYRGLAPNDDPALGLFARNPFSAAAPSSHVNGKDDSPWISASKSLLVAAGKYGQYGVVQIDLNKVFYYIDVSNGVPNGWSKINNWAKADQEVLIYGYVPPYAITAVDKFSK